MTAGKIKRHPLILWAQRDNVLFLTVEVEDMKVDKLICEGNKFFISGTNGSGKETYETDLELYAPINGSDRRQIATARQVELVITKQSAEWWPRLLKEGIKVPWLKVDFNKWVDEDEVDEEAGFDFGPMNFPGGDMMNFGDDNGQEDENSDSEGDSLDVPPLGDVDEAAEPQASTTAA